MKIIDLINDLFDYREFQPEKLPKKIKFNGNEFNYKDNSYYDKNDINIMSFIDHTLDLRVEIEIIEEVENKEYEDIKEIPQYEMADFLSTGEQMLASKINALIRNQKYILERLDKWKKIYLKL